jgi:hypothetical protein
LYNTIYVRMSECNQDTLLDCKTKYPVTPSPILDEPLKVSIERKEPLILIRINSWTRFDQATRQVVNDMPLEDPKPLIPLTSLNWPYVPDESSYPDPLKRDEPKTLQLH